jgi:3-oxoacyl-[acyl-carrier protein] reductase
MIYAGKTVVVTGARKGLGRALVDHFLAEGSIDVVGLSRGEGTVKSLRYSHIQVDVGDWRNVKAAFAEIKHLDVLVNCAGVGTSGIAMMMPVEDIEATVRTNFLGTIWCSREAARLMRNTGGGRIINIGSIHTVLEPIGASAYVGSKAGMMAYCRVLAKEIAPFGITVNTLGLSPFQTDMFEALSAQKRDLFIRNMTFPRMATVGDVTNVVDFFASPSSSFITAQAIYLGGIHG